MKLKLITPSLLQKRLDKEIRSCKEDDEMQLPYGAVKDDFEKCKKIVAKLTNDNKNLDEVTLTIMNIAYSTGGVVRMKRHLLMQKHILK